MRKSMSILFERADRTREKYKRSLSELASLAMGKMGWCISVNCEFSRIPGTYVLNVAYGKKGDCITVYATEFFEMYEHERQVSLEQLLKCERL